MSFWVEVVCDKCADRGPGMHVFAGAAFTRELDAEAKSEGWQRATLANVWPVHICPSCHHILAAAAGEEEPNP